MAPAFGGLVPPRLWASLIFWRVSALWGLPRLAAWAGSMSSGRRGLHLLASAIWRHRLGSLAFSPPATLAGCWLSARWPV
jgi:hypothetical protein